MYLKHLDPSIFMNNLDEILRQSPIGTTQADVERIYAKYEGNTVDILTELWNIEKKAKSVSNMSVEEMHHKNKLAEVRDICNAFDEEMEQFLSKKMI